MADPHVLYVVSTIVVLALVAWVIAVNAAAPLAVDVTKASAPPSPQPPPEAKAEAAGAKAEPKAEAKAEAKAELAPKEGAAPKVEPAPKPDPAPKAEAEARTEADASFEPERPSRAGLRNYDEIQDEPKGGGGSGDT